MNTIGLRRMQVVLSVAAAAASGLVISAVAAGFRPVDPHVALARGQAVLERTEHVRTGQAMREGQFRTAAVTTIVR